MDVTQRRIRAGFTLVELLVVIVIIGILVSLVVVAAPLALDAAHRTRIKVELDNIGMAFQQYKNENGSYPPNLVVESGPPPEAAIVRHFKKAFPRSLDDPRVLVNLQMTSSEAVVFWLGGFSSDPTRPLSGPNGPTFLMEERTGTFEFDQARLVPTREDPASGIKLYEYHPPDLTKPYVYFNTSGYDAIPKNSSSWPQAWPVYLDGTTHVHAYLEEFERNSQTLLRFVNAKSFQVLVPGTDDEWGEHFHDPRDAIAFPDGPFTGGHADNLTNFTTGTLEDAQP